MKTRAWLPIADPRRPRRSASRAGRGGRSPFRAEPPCPGDPAWPPSVLPGPSYEDVDIRIQFKPISGQEDAPGGIVFRFDRGRYYSGGRKTAAGTT